MSVESECACPYCDGLAIVIETHWDYGYVDKEILCTECDNKPPADEDFYKQLRKEAAMEAGMAFGCNGYNDYMGYSLVKEEEE